MPEIQNPLKEFENYKYYYANPGHIMDAMKKVPPVTAPTTRPHLTATLRSSSSWVGWPRTRARRRRAGLEVGISPSHPTLSPFSTNRSAPGKTHRADELETKESSKKKQKEEEKKEKKDGSFLFALLPPSTCFQRAKSRVIRARNQGEKLTGVEQLTRN